MKQLIIDKEHPNGIIVEVPDELNPIPYEERVAMRVRGLYSIDAELAILRQRDSKPEEFQAYFDAVEAIKAEEKLK